MNYKGMPLTEIRIPGTWNFMNTKTGAAMRPDSPGAGSVLS